MLPAMGVKESPLAIGNRRSRQLRHRVGEDLATARVASGMSVREVARLLGIGPGRVERFERGDPETMTIDLAARYAAAVGHQLAASVYPFGDPVRDRAQLALIARFRARVHASLEFRAEVAMPLAGDRRSADAVLDGIDWDAMVEAETRLWDIQLVERKARAKQRDLGARRVILLVADTTHNRAVLRLHPELGEQFPVGTRAGLAALGKGKDPGGDCLVVM